MAGAAGSASASGGGEFEIPQVEVPRDDEGFTESFAVDDVAGIRAFFDRYGFVVVRDVADADECAATRDDIWRLAEGSSRGEIKRDDPSTWTMANWRFTGMVDEGIIGGSALFTPAALRGRTNPRLHAAFAAVLRTKKLLVNQDRYALFRPTQGPRGDSQYATLTNLHLDMNPWQYIEDGDNAVQISQLSRLRYRASIEWILENNEPGCAKVGELHVQGMVNLLDNHEKDGGFWLVPGFRDVFADWAAAKTQLRREFGLNQRFCMLPKTETDAYRAGVRVTSRAGSAIIWDQRTLHGSKANESENLRMAQFFKFFAVDHPASVPARMDARRASILKKVEACKMDPQTDLTPHGRRVFGIDPWPDDADDGGDGGDDTDPTTEPATGGGQ